MVYWEVTKKFSNLQFSLKLVTNKGLLNDGLQVSLRFHKRKQVTLHYKENFFHKQFGQE